MNYGLYTQLPPFMRRLLVISDGSEEYNTIRNGVSVPILGKIPVSWIGFIERRTAVNLPRKRTTTWFNVSAEDLEYDLSFGCDTINELSFLRTENIP